MASRSFQFQYDAPQLPNAANVNALVAPLMSGIDTYRGGMNDKFKGDRQLASEAMDRERLGLAKAAAGRAEANDAEARKERMMKNFGNMALAVVNEPDEAKAKAYMDRLVTLPGLAAAAKENGIDLTDHRAAARLMAARAGVLPDPLEQRKAQLGIQLHEAQLQQFKTQTPDYRASIAPGLGLAPGTPEHSAFVINGTYTPRAPKYEKVGNSIVRIDADGSTKEVFKGDEDFSKLPESSAKAAGFATRMVDAEKNLQELMTPKAAPTTGPGRFAPTGASPQVFDPTSAKTGVLNATNGTPLETVTNYALRSPEHQRYMQAAEQWIRAFLRKESGAAIGKDEFVRDFKVYFPQPGDSPETIQQKAAARQAAVKSFVGETRGFFAHTSPEQAKYFDQLTGGGKTASPAAPAAGPRQRYVNPSTGQTIEWNGSQWVQVE